MQFPEEFSGGGVGGWVGAIAATVIGGGLMLRKWLSRDAVDRAGDKAEVNIIETLTIQLAVATARADAFAKERNESVREIGEQKAQIAKLTVQVEMMQAQLERMYGQTNPSGT
ncbi:hypothetical protein L506_0505 [Bordetella bronchiseptica GA96-01]|uniref:hypothetical protein n=1 Tax=Bordetella bronchiseptica TaxID=518 RepID=UPI0004598C79|nr:hypothetical protein [Bordetella bronchiseptica]AZW29154.1 chemotaxis protein [Bordetella bronchiseptica]KCV45591.1 hypothetical protein L572_0560 [Bordetella bronchiseptica 345]KDC38555.1 hypothetical protein L506_0505 [Bordetella bronchiseptica GA96-01]